LVGVLIKRFYEMHGATMKVSLMCWWSQESLWHSTGDVPYSGGT